MASRKWAPAVGLGVVLVGAIAGVVVSPVDPVSMLVLPTLAPTVVAPTAQASSITPSPTLMPTPTSTPTPEPSRAPDVPLSPVHPTPDATAQPAATPSPTATPTLTPTPKPTQTPFSLSEPTLIGVTPTLSDTTPVPTPVQEVPGAAGAINFVVLGSDRRPDWEDWHTDVVQVVSIQPKVPAVTVLSIPRDLYLYIPGFWMSRINFADMYGELYGYGGGGSALVQQTLLYNLGISVDHYVRTDFAGFKGIVDALGGVEIPVHCRLQDYWPYPDENGEYQIKVMEPGVHLMDGPTALWYARSRKTTSVFARERRQQQVLQAIWRRSRSLDILPRLPAMWEQLRSAVVTDIEFGDALPLAEMAFRLEAQNVRFRSIGYNEVIPWTTPSGGSVFLPDWEKIEPVVSEALGPIPEGRMWRQLQTIEVWNGTGGPSWDQLAADRLFREGFVAVIGQADSWDYPQTKLVDFTSTSKGSAIPYLQWMFNVSAADVVSAPDENSGVQYRLIIGRDYETCRRP